MATVTDLRVEEGECTTLSPGAHRFKDVYRQERPRSAPEVRKILGLSDESMQALHDSGACCIASRRPAAIASLDELDAQDPAVRSNARQLTYQAFNAYVYGGAAGSSDHLLPMFDKYLEISKAVLNIAWLQDIEVFDGATLTISANTHAVYARKITIHRTGRIVCIGATTFRVTSVEGLRRNLIDSVKNVVGSAIFHQ